MTRLISLIRYQRVYLALLVLVIGAAAFARAEVRLPSIFADHMVVQRNLPVHVWGMAAPNEACLGQFPRPDPKRYRG